MSNPIVLAAKVAALTDDAIYELLHRLKPGDGLDDFEQAVLDEAQLRGVLTASEAEAVSKAQQPVSLSRQPPGG